MVDWLYHLLLFLHILGAVGLFMGVAVELTAMIGARQARTIETVRAWSSVNRPLAIFMPLTSTLIFLAGLAMLIGVWGWSHAWLDTALVLFLLTGLVASQVNAAHGRRLGALLARAGEGAVSPELRAALTHPRHWATTITTSALAVGILFLMVMKPDLTGTLIAVGVALVLGVLLSWLVIRQGSRREAPAGAEQSMAASSASQQ
jgi:ABC-type bacteriocin/lantibiotic exporter with double-glycine peptidase domain